MGRSDHPRGLGGRESRPQGQGVTVGRSPHRQLGPDRQGRSPQGNLPEGHSLSQTSGSAEASLTEEPGAGILAARRSVRGRRVTGVPTATVPGQSGT